MVIAPESIHRAGSGRADQLAASDPQLQKTNPLPHEERHDLSGRDWTGFPLLTLKWAGRQGFY